MKKTPGSHKLTIPSSMEMVKRVEVVTGKFAKQMGLSEDEEASLCIAVTEAVINAITHGNHQDPGKQVEMEFDLRKDVITVTVRDQGNGFDPKSLPDPRTKENLLKPSGRGILMIRSCMDEVEIRPSNRGTELKMVKRTCQT
jgi:serine/threonine-protein kinase RsbW